MLQTQADKFSLLTQLGFNTPNQGTIPRAALPELYEHLKAVREELPYDVDGIVLALPSLERQAELGWTSDRKCPRGQIALKYPAKSGVVTIREIFVSTDGGAHLSPVAVFDPLEMQGAEIRRSHLKSFRWMTSRDARVKHFAAEHRRQGLTAEEALAQAELDAGTEECVGVGSVVEIVRSGDVIPTIKRVVSNLVAEVTTPDVCPCCSSPVVENGAYLDCSNGECPAKEANRMVRFLTNLRVKGLGQDTLVLYAEAGVTVLDFFLQDDFAALEAKIANRGDISKTVWQKIKAQLVEAQK